MNKDQEILYNFVKKIQNASSPGMYLGKVSLIYLQIYLSGFTKAQWEIAGEYTVGFKDFSLYVGEYFHDNRNVGWASIILSHTESEEEAFETFYRLFDEYMNSIQE